MISLTSAGRSGQRGKRGLGIASLLVLLGVFVFTGSVQAGISPDWGGGFQVPRVLTMVQIPAEPEGYRMEHFREAVPATLRGAIVISTVQAQRLRDSGTIFVDVLPRPPKPPGLPEGTIWRDRPRYNIPGSVWLPNVGFGALNPEVEAYFRDNLTRVTDGDKNADLVFYCLADCWMSWNAAKRALSYGYTRVFWFPEGSDGWRTGGGDLVEAAPVPMAP